MKKYLLTLYIFVGSFTSLAYTQGPIAKHHLSKKGFNYFIFNGANNSELHLSEQWQAIVKEPIDCESCNQTIYYLTVKPAITKKEFDAAIENVNNLSDLLDRLLERRPDIIICTRKN